MKPSTEDQKSQFSCINLISKQYPCTSVITLPYLAEQFPQFEYKLSKNAVSYRWCQLAAQHLPNNLNHNKNILQQESKNNNCNNIKQNLFKEQVIGQIKNRRKILNLQQSDSSQDSSESFLANSISQSSPKLISQRKISDSSCNMHELQKALQKAQSKQDNDEEGFMIYKPQYKSILQSFQANNLNGIQQKSLNSLLEQKAKQKQNKNGSHRYKYQQEQQQEQQEQQINGKNGLQEERKFLDENEDDPNYSMLIQQYNHYNQIMSNYGMGYHEDSATDSGSLSDDENANMNALLLPQDQSQKNALNLEKTQNKQDESDNIHQWEDQY